MACGYWLRTTSHKNFLILQKTSSFEPLRPWLVPQSPGQGRVSPTEGWHRLPWQQTGQGGSWREKWGGGSVGEGNLGISEWRQAGIGAGAAGDDGTGTSQPCPKGRVRQDRWEGKSAPPLRGELTSELLLIREKRIKGSFTPFSLLRSSKQPHPSPCSSRGADFLAQGPGHPQISQPGFPPASCRQGKAKAPAGRDVAPGHPLLSSLCHEGLHHPAQTRAGIGSPKIPNLAWA